MADAEQLPAARRPSPVNRCGLLLLLCALAGNVSAQTNVPAGGPDLADLLGAAQEWAEENLDETWLAALDQLDRQKVEAFLAQLEQGLGGPYVLDLAALAQTARAILPLLEAHEETRPYAAWLRSRADYFDAAEELRRSLPPPPKLRPGQPPPPATNPPPALQRQVWARQLARRPWPPEAETLVPKLKQIFASERVPGQLVWLAEVESAFDRRARSPAGAAGLFQLMPATAQRFGLRRWPFDQRYQVEPSARAAARYLRLLHTQFQDWPLALAAYNAGEGTVRRAVERERIRSFDRIAPRLPAETQMYVPKVEATLLRREGVRLAELAAPPPG